MLIVLFQAFLPGLTFEIWKYLKNIYGFFFTLFVQYYVIESWVFIWLLHV